MVSRGTVAADITGDGRADLLVLQNYIVDEGTTLGSHSLLNAFANPGSAGPWTTLDPPSLGTVQAFGFSLEAIRTNSDREAGSGISVLADLNGDGRQDIVTRGVFLGDFSENWFLLNRYEAAGPGADPNCNHPCDPDEDANCDPGAPFELSGFCSPQSGAYQVCTLGDPSNPIVDCLKQGAVARVLVQGDPPTFTIDQRLGKRMLDVNADGLDDHAVSIGPEEPVLFCPLGVWQCGNVTAYDCDNDNICRQECDTYDPPCPVGTSCVWPQRCMPTSYKVMRLNNGADFLPSATAWNVPISFDHPKGNESIDDAVRFLDLNGDGRVDLLKATASGGSIWLNTGHPARQDTPPTGFPLWQPDDTRWSFPAGAEVVDPTGADRGVRFADVNGDGMVDILHLAGGAAPEVWLNSGVVPDLLETVTTPLGAATTFGYTPSTAFDNTKGDDPDLAQVMQLVTSIEIDDNNGVVSTQSIRYEGGEFDRIDREFRGFRKVKVVDEAGRRTETTYHQSAALAGSVERVDVFEDATGALWRSAEYEYTDAGGVEPFVSLPTGVIQLEVDGDPSVPARRTRTALDYERGLGGEILYGNLKWVTEYGEVDAANADLYPPDTRTTEFTYAKNDDPTNGVYLVDRVATQVVRAGLAGTGGVKRESWFFYDDHTAVEVPPTKGNLTKETRVNPQGANATTTAGYDAYGNVRTIVSPRVNEGTASGSTTIQYDVDYHAFPSVITDPLGFRHQIDYGPLAGGQCAVLQPAGAGLPREVRGPNQAGAPRTLCYDVFGRVKSDQAPGDLGFSSWVYVDAIGSLSVTRADRATTAGTGRQSTSLLDGLGRAVETQTEGPQASIVYTSRSYDAAGRLKTVSAPGFGAPGPLTILDYDLLDREVKATLPGTGRVYTTTYLTNGNPGGTPVSKRGAVESLDPNDRKTEYQLDPFGRVTAVRELSAAPPMTATYVYAVTGELETLTDTLGNQTAISYDGLGRRLTLSDPDAAPAPGPPIVFSYDANGNLRTRTDASLRTTEWLYDSLDRPTTRIVNSVTDATWAYDTAVRGAGLLARRTDAAGVYEVNAYDLLGRPVAETRKVGGQSLPFATLYDPLGQVSSRSYPSGRQLLWTRDGKGLLTGITTPPGGTALAGSIRWDAAGRLTHWTAGNGVTTDTAFDPATLRLQTIQVARAGTPLEELTYGFDPGDRVTSIADGVDATRSLAFPGYDGVGRLTRAVGPYADGYARASLHYAYDALGNLKQICQAGESATDCAADPGHTVLETLSYPVSPAARPHAPTAVDGQSVGYTATGELTTLAGRSHGYDPLGQLTSVSAPGLPTLSFAYDAGGRRARSEIGAGPGAVVRQFVTSDFEWDESFGLARIHVGLAGEPIATFVEQFDPGASGGASAASSLRPQGDPLLGLAATAGGLGLAGLLLLLQLAALRRAGERVGRPAVAGSMALVFLLWTVSPALGQGLPDGDVRTDGQLDSADALRLLQLLRSGGASAEEILHGDVAPPEAGDGALDAGDALLILRALNGADVDADGLDGSQERLLDTNPFRKDTDGDGTLDGEEDADGDGLGNAVELALGSDPLRPDTDEDGVRDGDDPSLFSGVVYRHSDHLGSTVVTTHADDTEVVRAVYRPFGEAVRPSAGASAELGEFGFTGQRFEREAALYDYGARWYDPALGKFLQPDPIVGNPFDPQSLNRYSYVLNDPGNRVDPTGLVPLVAEDATTYGGQNDVLARIVGSGAPASEPLSNYLPQGNSSILFNAGSGSGTSIGGAGKGTFVLEQGTGNTTFGSRSQSGERSGVTLVARPLQYTDQFNHSSLFVTDPETGEITRQYSLQGGATEFDRQLNQLGPGESPSSTFRADRNAFLNPGGANQHFNIGPPSGMSAKAFAEGVIRLGDSYSAARYSNLIGPNSNSAAAFPLHVLGATVPSIPRTPWLNYYSDLRPR